MSVEWGAAAVVDALGLALSVLITVFWIGVWHLHLISIVYGKWRLHRPAAPRSPARLKASTAAAAAASTSPPAPAAAAAAAAAAASTIVQVEEARASDSIPPLPLPGVSILKPLVGVDPYLLHNLHTFFTQNYPQFELLFCVMDESDPAVMIVRSLMKQHPDVDARIFIGGEQVGVNPKINNMMPGYRAAKYDLVLVSDSGIMMREDTLLDMVYTMLAPEVERGRAGAGSRVRRCWQWLRNRGATHGVGLVHQMPFCLDRDELGFPACLEKVYFGTAHARIYLSADAVGVNCPTGMSALMRRHLLEARGGMAAFGQYLAEDYFFARAVTEQGWTVCIASQPAWQNSAVCHLAHFQGRLQRWAKLRLAMVPVTTLLEPLQECFLLGVLASLAVSTLLALSALGVFLVHVITWFLLDWILLQIVQNGHLQYSKLDFVIGWVFRETTCFLLFADAILHPRIHWKSAAYRLQWGGRAQLVDAAAAAAAPVAVTSCSRTMPPADGHWRPALPADSPSRTVSAGRRGRHIRSRSLPQRHADVALLHSAAASCDDRLPLPMQSAAGCQRFP